MPAERRAMQHEVVSPQPLLDVHGNIREPGYATSLVWEYDRAQIQAPRWRIKEWDYYYVGDQSHGFAVTLSDAGFVSSLSASVLGFGMEEPEPFQLNGGALGLFPLGKLGLPSTSVRGDVAARVGAADFSFENDGNARHLAGTIKNYARTESELAFDLLLRDAPRDTMAIATPFEKERHFYYNQKINCLTASGWVSWGGGRIEFSPGSALGVLDWGRGVWTYNNTWYWGSGSMRLASGDTFGFNLGYGFGDTSAASENMLFLNGHVWTYNNTWYWGSGSMRLASGDTFGFNLGYGFGDTSAASENMLFLNGHASKLGDVRFDIPQREDGTYDYLGIWRFTDEDGRLDLRMEPVLDREDPVNLGVVCMIPHQVFGRWYGTATLDGGRVVTLDGQMAFAEHVHNKW